VVGGEKPRKFAAALTDLQTVLGEHQDAVILEEYLHDIMGRREASHALEQQLLERQCRRRKKTRAAFFEEWPKLDRRGRTLWSAPLMP